MGRWFVVVMVSVLASAACSGGDDDDTGLGDDGGTASVTTTVPDDECTDVVLEAGDTGVTESEIHIGVIADTSSPLRPGLFQGSVDAIQGWAEWKNAGGGLACRDVVVDVYDSMLSADEARNSVISACGSDVALVGTSALFLNESGMNELEGCGLPDLAILQTEPVQQCSRNSFVVLPFNSSCPYSGTGERTYDQVVGPSRYYLDTFGADALHGVWLVPSDLPSTITAIMPSFRASQQVGIGNDYETGMSALAEQSAYTPVIQEIKDNSSTYVRNGLDYKGTVLLRKEADVQGVDSVLVWDCSVACYDRRLIDEGGAAVEDQYVWIFHLPFEDAGANETVDAFLSSVDKPDTFGAQSWAAAELFAAVVDEIVAADGLNGITRARILETVPTMTDFDAGGLIPPTNFGPDAPPAGCFVLLQVQGGEFVRVLPEEPGEFACPPADEATVHLTIDPVAEFNG